MTARESVRAWLRPRIQRALSRAGYRLQRVSSQGYPRDFSPADAAAFEAVRSYTMTSPERIYALRQAVAYITAARIPGAIVECGVWKGGSMMAVATALLELGITDRELYLFDTFEGMTEPTEADVDSGGTSAHELLADARSQVWARAPLEDVRLAMQSTGYEERRIHYVQGRVENTVPGKAPEGIAILRLDTDWYESTRHELLHLYPRLARGGALIIDDYGHWRGSRRATDEFLRNPGNHLLLGRIDETARMAVKI